MLWLISNRVIKRLASFAVLTVRTVVATNIDGTSTAHLNSRFDFIIFLKGSRHEMEAFPQSLIKKETFSIKKETFYITAPILEQYSDGNSVVSRGMHYKVVQKIRCVLFEALITQNSTEFIITTEIPAA